MPLPLDRYIAHEQFEKRLNRDLADRIGELTDAAKVTLVDAFCGDAAFDVDANNEPVITATAERTIDAALSPLWALQDELERKSRRA